MYVISESHFMIQILSYLQTLRISNCTKQISYYICSIMLKNYCIFLEALTCVGKSDDAE